MATRSRIGIKLRNGRIRSVYCHWDGTPNRNGKTLRAHYSQRENVEKLIAGGSMSQLHTRSTWDSGKVIRKDDQTPVLDQNGKCRYENDREPQPLYYTEWGEDLEIQTGTLKQFLSGNMDEEYAYLFTLKGEWVAYKILKEGGHEVVAIP